MAKDQILLRRKAVKTWHEGNDLFTLIVNSELAAFKGQTPYFATTATLYQNKRVIAGGCLHDEIMKHCPEFKDAIALHFSDENGEPMHAASNAWYWMSGALGGAGEEYHGASGRDGKTTAECLTIWAEHMRIPHADAVRYRDLFAALKMPLALDAARLMDAEYGPVIHAHRAYREEWTVGRMVRANEARAWSAAKTLHDNLVKSCAPRWAAEAAAVKQFLAANPVTEK